MKIDKQKANAAIDDYLAAIRDPNNMPYREASTYVADARLERFGVIANTRTMDFADHCVLWSACIAICKRVREVSRIEKEQRAVRAGKSLEKTIRHLKDPKSTIGRGIAGKRFRQHLADNGVK
ncbi:MAG TPA: hypothetical protein VFO40_04875 [Chthoniobacterales bacterium]|nr:hypothetical protein [Chthoniobacterales bacterium]